MPLTGARRRVSGLLTGAAASAILVLPCFWQSRIQAGDLGSHVYNAWLANLIERGQAHGLYIAHQWTNTLFDLLLAFLFPSLGPGAAQRIAVSVAVLVLAWGAFSLVCAAAHSRPWFLMPAIAMLAYGWVFHMGFFNYYISVGLCLGAIAVCWRPSRPRWIGAAALLATAWVAHAVPVAWAVFAIAYLVAARRLRPRYRWFLTGTAISLLAGFSLYLRAHYQVNWSAAQNFAISGIDQLVVFGPKYFLVAAGALVIGTLLFIRLVDIRGVGRTLLAIPLHLTICAAAGAFLIPGRILLPGESQPLGFIAERWSLVVALSVCALLGGVKPQRRHILATAVLAAVFFAFVYLDERALNQDEDRMEAALSALPQGSRVVAAPVSSSGRIATHLHMIDRICIGRCFSYANYEPSSGHFRVRVRGRNPFVAAEYADSWAMQYGNYRVRERDLPLFQVSRCEKTDGFCITALAAGAVSGDQTLERTNSNRIRFQTTTAAYK